MIDEDICDPILEELREISKTIKELRQLVSQQINIENTNNILLRKIIECQSVEDIKSEAVNIDVDKYLNKNLLIINSSRDEGIRITKMISAKMHGKFVVSEAKTDGELVGLINSLSDNDIIFVDVSESTLYSRMREVIYECIKNKYINFSVGKGAQARNIQLDLPAVNYIIYTYLENFLSNDLKKLLVLVE